MTSETKTTLRCFYNKALYTRNNRLAVPTITHGPRRKNSSSASFMNISADFVKRVEDMESSILVPSKLLDIECKDDPAAPPMVNVNGSSNLYEVFNLIKKFKEKLTSVDLDYDQLAVISPMDIDETLNLTASQLSSLDSGHWSSNGSSYHSEEETLSCSSDNDTPVSEASFRVKRTIQSAKGLVAFLVELSDVSEYLISRYCEEFQCDA
ncbi:hypothetical protein HDE_06096 [Halotydeus destructor]|nr:hypothetical protein HDE_06096 [Halotydeus destructor]